MAVMVNGFGSSGEAWEDITDQLVWTNAKMVMPDSIGLANERFYKSQASGGYSFAKWAVIPDANSGDIFRISMWIKGDANGAGIASTVCNLYTGETLSTASNSYIRECAEYSIKTNNADSLTGALRYFHIHDYPARAGYGAYYSQAGAPQYITDIFKLPPLGSTESVWIYDYGRTSDLNGTLVFGDVILEKLVV